MEDNPQKELTFEDIEKEFGFKTPLSENAKSAILERYNSIEDYRGYLTEFNSKPKQISNSLKSSPKYVVTLETPEGTSGFWCYDDQYILDAGEEVGLDLPNSCRAGACSTCCSVLEAGEIDQSEQTFLNPDQIDAGAVLICVAFPRSNCRLETGSEDWLY